MIVVVQAPLPQRFFGAYITKWPTFFTDLLTQCDQQIVLVAFLWQFQVPSISRVSLTMQRVHIKSILKHAIVRGEKIFQVYYTFRLPFPSKICFLQVVGALRHNLFLCPFVTPLWVFALLIRTLVLSLWDSFPLCGVLCFNNFAKVSSFLTYQYTTISTCY